MAFTLRPAVGENFVDREGILVEMMETLTDPKLEMGFALVGQRRIGKTSILRELANRLRKRNDVVVIYLSVWDLVENSLFEFCQKLSLTTLDAFKERLSLKFKLANLVKVPSHKIFEFLKNIDVKIRVLEDIELSLSLKRKEPFEPNLLLEKTFGGIEKLAGEFKLRAILILDEFPSLMDLKNERKLGEGIIRKIRTIHERLHNVVLLISGSIKKTMEMVALSSASAFYRQLIVREVPPFDKETIGKLIEGNLGFPLKEEVVGRVFELTQGIPFYVQFIGKKLEGKGSQISTEMVDGIFDEFIKEEGNYVFAAEFQALSDKERLISVEMAAKELRTVTQISKSINESPNTISQYLVYLTSKGVLEKRGKGYEFVDNGFREWLKTKSIQ